MPAFAAGSCKRLQPRALGNADAALVGGARRGGKVLMSQGEIRSRRAACRFADGRQAYWPGNATKRGAGTVRARRLRPAIGAGLRPDVIAHHLCWHYVPAVTGSDRIPSI